ncbi:hypothetical protein SBF1_5680001 [Candidatus Desulfosporosinus infrequens]|uniref:Uncharacterized protein n=1 Tax=Candidatus Desulfosporosinus infrequens TaxID=2043169 RepID=A0A2U3LKN3_9FIRM|nr:hypothetical protein SBF1_5680001 [Candidatus Desulfosporosinus infrequens]
MIDFNLPYDKDDALKLIPPHHQKKLEEFDEIVATGYRRTRLLITRNIVSIKLSHYEQRLINNHG